VVALRESRSEIMCFTMLLKRSLGRGIANKTNDCLAYSVFITELVLVCL